MSFVSDMQALLPSWAPSWLPLVLLAPVLLFALAFFAMPFSVFGLRGRMEGIEARLDEMQHEIRQLSLRLPGGPARGVDAEDVYTGRLRPVGLRDPEPVQPSSRPPIPPAPGDASWGGRSRRAEPRL